MIKLISEKIEGYRKEPINLLIGVNVDIFGRMIEKSLEIKAYENQVFLDKAFFILSVLFEKEREKFSDKNPEIFINSVLRSFSLKSIYSFSLEKNKINRLCIKLLDEYSGFNHSFEKITNCKSVLRQHGFSLSYLYPFFKLINELSPYIFSSISRNTNLSCDARDILNKKTFKGDASVNFFVEELCKFQISRETSL